MLLLLLGSLLLCSIRVMPAATNWVVPLPYFLSSAILEWCSYIIIIIPNAYDPRVTISSEGVLTVTDAQASDRGVYTVPVSNIAVRDG